MRINKHREHARAVVDDLIADRERAACGGQTFGESREQVLEVGATVARAASWRDQAPIWALPSTAGTTLYLESWNEAPPP